MSSTAALRLTATTELLEEILFLAVCNGISVRPNGHNYRPAYKLFALQRVSRDFHHTIAGSQKLRRLMFYETIEASTFRATFSHHAPTRWLLDDMLRPGIAKIHFIPEHDATATIELRPLPFRDPGFDDRINWHPDDPGWTRAEASWRNIKICNAKEGMVPITVITKVVWHGGKDYWKMRKRAIEKRVPNILSIRWNFEDDDTLGQVYARFENLRRVLEDAWQADTAVRARRFGSSISESDAYKEDNKRGMKVWKELEKLSDPPRPVPKSTAVGEV
ncbi:hypothetical protein AC578_7746 [Pseudocercospora eumusae]|uniref:Uncharacterized protein n=1 Tax=Pseudocercospora eumusae TaxID=321146 RepID=A0A139HL89_9PEZI|nr:hypothetical protein AC578_7746 [Pseudocercospora eumusae]